LVAGYLAVIAAAALSWGCGGGAKDSLHGTLRGQTASAADASFELRSIPFVQGPAKLAAVVLSSAPHLCAESAAGARDPSARYLVLLLGEIDKASGALSPPSAAGDFPIVLRPTSATGTRFAIAQAIGTDASCAALDSLSAEGTAGSVQLTTVTSARLAGTLAIDLQATDAQGNPTGSADHLTGAFDAATCEGVLANVLIAKPQKCG
jgi:hypothetical protein